MHHSFSPAPRAASLLSLLLLGLLVAGGGSVAPAVAGEGQGAGNAPRTSWGDPDLQGVWTANEMHAVPLERPEDLGAPGALSDEAAAERREAATQRTVNAEGIGNYDRAFRDTALGYTRQQPSTQASLIVDPPDGRLPPLTAAEQRRREAAGPQRYNLRATTWEEMGNWPRCITRGALTIVQPSGYNNGVQIVQGPGHVAITKEMLHETRVIPVDDRPRVGADVSTWSGDARGRWEGDTLVVEIANFNGRSSLFGATANARLTERFTRIGPDRIEYLFTVEDPAVWTRPWTGRMTISKDDSQYELVEYACHEGNYAMVNSLSGARAALEAEGGAR